MSRSSAMISKLGLMIVGVLGSNVLTASRSNPNFFPSEAISSPADPAPHKVVTIYECETTRQIPPSGPY